MSDSKLVPGLDNALLNFYLAGVVQRLAEHSRRPGLDYSCKVLNVASVNAFSLPGGHIYVTRGLLEFTGNESELAAVIAHEIGHIAAHHALNRFSLELRSRTCGLWRRRDAQRGRGGAETAFQAMGMPLVDMLALRYDRANEQEAEIPGWASTT